MTEMTNAELTRAYERLDRQRDTFVSKEVYTRDMKEFRSDVAEIRDFQKWLMRLMVANLFGLVISVLIFVVTRGL